MRCTGNKPICNDESSDFTRIAAGLGVALALVALRRRSRRSQPVAGR